MSDTITESYILPSSKAEELSKIYSKSVSSEYKKTNGQFFTPLKIAEFMANEATYNSDTLKILDPGCGTGILSCALIEKLSNSARIKDIELHTYETDENIIPYSNKSFDFLKEWLAEKGISFRYQILKNDFILRNASVLNNSKQLFFESSKDDLHYYDYIISNPPYFKISKADIKAKLCDEIIHGQPNIYALFLGVSAHLLKPNGELIFIIPRSFSSGEYFRKFRDNFFNTIEIHSLHLFNSRTEAFKKENVLQENIIIKAKRKNGSTPEVKISVSNGISDLKSSTNRYISMDNLVNLNSKEKVLYLPTDEEDEKIISIFKNWTNKLKNFNTQISTGPVVPFRATEFLIESEELDSVPLFWLINTSKMRISHPVNKKNKKQWIIKSKNSFSLLLINTNYVFLRRFSAKDDKSRLVATPYFSDCYNYEHIGIENHLNYIYKVNGSLDEHEVIGLAALLNSTLFDAYFRTFNGNTQVSATELRQISFPDWNIIQELGLLLRNKQYDNQEVIDIEVNKLVLNDENRRSAKGFKRIRIA